MNNYQVGDLVRVSASFTDASGNAVDPDTVYCDITAPDGTKTTYTYGTDAEVVRDSAGNYHLDVDVTAAGRWCYAWRSRGTGQAAGSGSFHAVALCA